MVGGHCDGTDRNSPSLDHDRRNNTGAVVGALGWTAILLVSKTHPILKVVGAPIFFVFGAIIGALPLPTWGITPLVAFALRYDMVANITVGSIVILVLLATIAGASPLAALFFAISGQTFCGFLSSISQLLV